MKNKIKMLFNYRSKTIKDYSQKLNILPQNLSRKITNGNFKMDEFINLCDYLDIEVCLLDKNTSKYITSLTNEDVKK